MAAFRPFAGSYVSVQFFLPLFFFFDGTSVHLQLLIVLSLGRKRYLCYYTVFLYINKLFILV